MATPETLPPRLAASAAACGFSRVEPASVGPGRLVHPPDAAADTAGRAGWLVVAEGPAHADLAGAKADKAVLLAHPSGQFRFAPHARYPSFLWVPVTGDDLAEALAEHRRTEHAGGTTVALSLGLVRDGDETLDATLDNDPYCCSYPAPAAPDHDRGRPSTRLAVDTLHTRTRVTLEVYGNLLCAVVTYVPSPNSPVPTANAALGLDLPRDLPIDAAAFLLQWPVTSARQLCEQLRVEGPPDQHVVALISAELIGAPITPADLAIAAASNDRGLRRAAISVAGRRGFTPFLREARDREADPALRALIDQLMPQV